ncbi:MAG: YCF48-related protein [Ignavibacteriaceae bacterium]|nr:YCF48-related protein [Ignavibacteriaceae bacterium]
MKRSILFLTIMVTCLGSLIAQTGQDWKWLHPTPQGNTLRWVKAWSATEWYAVGSAGTFMKTTDAGATWTFNHKAGRPFATSGQTSNANDAHFFDMQNGIVVGSSSGIMKTTDGGNTWADVAGNPLTGSITLNQIFFLNNNVGYIAGSSGNLLKTTDGGNNWTLVPVGVTTTLYDIWTTDDQTILVPTTGGNIRRSTDGGATWAAVATGASFNIQKIQGDGTGKVLCAGSATNARISTDNGATWAAANTGIPTTTFWDIDYANSAWYLTGNSYAIYKSTNDGVSWDTVAVLAPVAQQPWTSTYYATEFSPSADSFVTVGGFGLINARFGQNIITRTTLAKPGTWYDIWASAPNGTVIAVGAPTVTGSSFDQVARSTDGGNTWALTPLTTGSTSTIWSIDMVDNNIGYLSGTLSAVYKTTNGGATWDSLSTTGLPAGATFRKVDFISPTTGWLFASTPNSLTNWIFKTTDGGLTWTGQTHGATGSAAQMYSSSMVNENYGYAVSWQPIPYKTTDGGATWTAQALVDAFGGFLYDIKMVDTAMGYAVGSSGRVYKTTNGGLLWDTLSVPTRSYGFQTLEVIDMNNVVIAGGTGVTMYTNDGGATWTLHNSAGSTLNGSYYTKDQQTQGWAVFALGSNGYIFKNTLTPVPVELVSLAANISGNDVTLTWKTATELNNYGFEIERKSASGNWAKIGFVAGNGTTTSPKSYTFADAGLTNGKYQYRLKQIDLDGSFDYSQSVEVEIGTPITFSLSQNYPNPFNPATTIAYSIPEAADVTLKVFDVTGTEVATLVNSRQDAGSYSFNFDASKLASGMYIYKIEAGKYNAVKKMMLLK